MLTTITALSVDPAGIKLACHGYSNTDENSTKGYLFVLDTTTGTIVSGLMEMTHDAAFAVKSAGFLLRDDGPLFLAVRTPATIYS